MIKSKKATGFLAKRFLPMRLFDILAIHNPEVGAQRTKVHLATCNGSDNPLEVYFCGDFDNWQELQTKKNFERDFVLGLIGLPTTDDWLLAGVYQSRGCMRIEGIENKSLYRYNLKSLSEFDDLAGRLIVGFSRKGRQSYLNAENWSESLVVREYLRERLSIAEFPGYRKVDLSRAELESVVAQSLESWRTALSSVAGVYLISDTASGRLYVGSATGEGGIWQRWTQYAANGHGGNAELRRMLREFGPERALDFRYSILEIADTHMTETDILARESHWKRVLLSREHGLNAN